MSRYAAETTVSQERSRAEIEEIVLRYGADQFMSGWEGNRALIGFRADGRFVRFVLTLPDRNERQFTHVKMRGFTKTRSEGQAIKHWEQAVRQRWRAMLLSIKAKLESVASKIETFEEAFMPHIVLPGGRTMSETILPQLEEVYRTGELPRLLPMLVGPGPETEVG